MSLGITYLWSVKAQAKGVGFLSYQMALCLGLLTYFLMFEEDENLAKKMVKIYIGYGNGLTNEFLVLFLIDFL